MASKRKKAPEGEAQLCRWQKFVPRRIHRRDIKGAPYNPRRPLSDKERKKLKGILEKHGLVNAVVWNEKSGNLVGGHQRLSILDALEGSDNYLLDVNAGSWTDAEEREINIALNNGEAQSDWDLDKLGDMLKDGAVDLVGTGFDAADIYQLLGDSPLIERDDAAIDELAEKLREAQQLYKDLAEKAAKRDGADFYLVLVARDGEQVSAFVRRYALDDNRYQDLGEVEGRIQREAQRAQAKSAS